MHSNHSYYGEGLSELKFPIPIITLKNFTLLKAGEKISFHINLSKFYDFKSVIKKGAKEFYVYYYNEIPVVVNNKELKEMDKEDNVLKPVYLSIRSLNSNPRTPYNYELLKLSSNCFWVIFK